MSHLEKKIFSDTTKHDLLPTVLKRSLDNVYPRSSSRMMIFKSKVSRCGRHRMVVVFTTICAIGAYHH